MLVLFVLFPALISVGLGLYGVRSRIYGKPGYDIDDFHDYSEMNVPEQQEHFLLAYEVTTKMNAELNTTKFSIFNYCIGYTFISLLLALATPLSPRFGIFSWISDLFSQNIVPLSVGILLTITLLPPVIIYFTLEADGNGAK